MILGYPYFRDLHVDMFATDMIFEFVSRSGGVPFCDGYAGEHDDKALHLGIPNLRHPHTDLDQGGMKITITGYYA